MSIYYIYMCVYMYSFLKNNKTQQHEYRTVCKQEIEKSTAINQENLSLLIDANSPKRCYAG